MGVYIKGMEMPEHGCNHCRFRAGNYCALIPGPSDCAQYVGLKQKRPDCPLVPVPPHGDLIDRDYLKLTFCSECTLYPDKCLEKTEDGCDWHSIAHLEMCPTIIPAEEETDGRR